MNDLPESDETSVAAATQRKDAVGLITPARIPGQVLPAAGDVFLGRRITPLTRRRLDNFRANRRGFWSLWIFLLFFGTSLFAEFLANDRPLLVSYAGNLYLPVLHKDPAPLMKQTNQRSDVKPVLKTYCLLPAHNNIPHGKKDRK